jgi:hypothetical protein
MIDVARLGVSHEERQEETTNETESTYRQAHLATETRWHSPPLALSDNALFHTAVELLKLLLT